MTLYYQEYLESLHQNKTISREKLLEVVKQVTKTKITHIKKVVAGEVNEVYDVSLANSTSLIVRIAHKGFPEFQQEQWAIAKCQKIGVPCPKILNITYEEIDGKDHAMCVMEKIDGEPLERGAIDFHALDVSLQQNLIYQAGEILSKIHSIKTQGAGYIQTATKRTFANPSDLFDEIFDTEEHLAQLFKTLDLNHSLLKKALKIISDYKNDYIRAPFVLTHGDYSHKHFMVKGTSVVAIIDWGSVRSDSPVHDFANWDFWFGDSIPTKWLEAGYQNKELFTNNYEELIQMVRIWKGLDNISWYSETKYSQMVDLVIGKLKTSIAFFD